MNKRDKSWIELNENDIREIILIIILSLVCFVALTAIEPKAETMNELWSVECDEVRIQYVSPWPLPPEDVCNSLE